MARRIKPAIYIFCDGETEVEYACFLKNNFRDVVAIQKPVKATFEKAQSYFKNEKKYRNYINEIDEIWFFIDVDEEHGDLVKWDERLKIIKQLRKLRKKPNIKIRLLMTTACIEYWLYLHFHKIQPSLKTVADKEKMEKSLQDKMPNYKKGDMISIHAIASKYESAIINGKWTIEQLRAESIPRDDSEDAVNEWLYKNTKSFTNVHVAIEYLEELRNT